MLRLSLTLVTILIACSGYAANLGTFGATYPVAERDALAEIEERAKGVDWRKVIQRNPIEAYEGPEDRVSLPRAVRDRTFQVDLTYTLQMDIPDGKGGILYQKGYSFNPLDYVQFSRTLLILNGNDPEQVKWFLESEYRRRIDVMVLLTEGRYGRLEKKLDVPLFYADSQVIERLKLVAVPSVVGQEGRVMMVREVAVPRGNRSSKKAGVKPSGGRSGE